MSNQWRTGEARIVRERLGAEPLASIAARVGRSESAVKQFAYKHGLSVAFSRKAPSRPQVLAYPSEIRSRAVELRASGLGLAAVAKACGVSHTAVWRWCKP